MKEKYKTLLLILGIIIIFYGALKFKQGVRKPIIKETIVLDTLIQYQTLRIDTVLDNNKETKVVIWRVYCDTQTTVKENKYLFK